MRNASILIALLAIVSVGSSVYLTNCSESATRTCVTGSNITAHLQSVKKGGSTVVATGTYDVSFFPCEEYNYNCGYMEESNDYLTIANGVQLNLTSSEFSTIAGGDATIIGIVQPFLGRHGTSASCLTKYFSLLLTDAQSTQVLSGYLNRQQTNLTTTYNSQKSGSSLTWSALNINIITAVLETAKYYVNANIYSTNFWSYLLSNRFDLMSGELKNISRNTSCLQCLRSAYLIDSVTIKSNKTQSVNFLVDESSSIGSTNFNTIKLFLTSFITQTNDDPTLTSITYYDSGVQFTTGFNNTKANILSQVSSKTFRGNANPNLGSAINQTISKITSAGLSSALPKVIVIIVGSSSVDTVINSAQYAQAIGISIVVVAITGSNSVQVQQIVNSNDNIINIPAYSSLSNLVPYLGNYIAKQFIDLKSGTIYTGGQVRTPVSPCYVRVPRSASPNQFGKITITYYSDPLPAGQTILQSHFDPFPDNYSLNQDMETYRTTILTRQIFIAPQSSESFPLKKNITTTQTMSYSYLTLGGNNLKFDIKLEYCSTINCTQERVIDMSIGSLNADKKLSEDPQSSNVLSPSVFAGITGGLVILGAATYLSITKLKKLMESLENQPLNNQDLNGQNTHMDLDNEDQRGLENQEFQFYTQEGKANGINNQFQRKSNISKKQKQSHKSKQDNRSDRSDKSDKSDKSHASNKHEQSKKVKQNNNKSRKENSCEKKSNRSKSPKHQNDSNNKRPKSPKKQNNSPKQENNKPKSPKHENNRPKSPKHEDNRPKSPKQENNRPKSPKHGNEQKKRQH